MTNFSHLAWEELEHAEHEASETFAGCRRVTICRRAKVAGGWLVQSLDLVTQVGGPPKGPSVATGLTFVPDPTHEWRPTSGEGVHEVFGGAFDR